MYATLKIFTYFLQPFKIHLNHTRENQMSLFFLNGIIFDTKYKYLIAKKTVQNNCGIFLALILKRSVQKIVRFWTRCFLALFYKKSIHFMFINP